MSVTEKRTELLVGLFVFFGLAIMAILILQFGRFGEQLREKYPLRITFPDATGIVQDSDVRLGGAKIGRVASTPQLTDTYTGVYLDVEIYNGVKIPRNSLFSIRTSGLMGDSYIGIQSPEGPAGDYVQPGDVIAGQRGGDIQSITATAEEISVEAHALIKDMQVTMKDVRTAVQNLNSFLEKLDSDVLSPENRFRFSDTLANIRATSENLSVASAKLEPVLEEAKVAAGNASKTFETADGVLEELRPAFEEFQKTAVSARQTMEKIDSGDGLFSALINDESLRAEFEALISNMREHGILWYKDSAAKEAEEASRDGSSQKPGGLFRKKH